MVFPISWDELVLVLIEEGEITIQNELYTDEYYLKEKKKNRSNICTELFLSVYDYWCNTLHQN